MQFNPDTFEFDWEQLDDQGKILQIRQAPDLPPSSAVLPVIQGILSSDYSFRACARESLVQILKNITARLEVSDQKDGYLAALKDSALVSSRIYREITPYMPLSELKYFFAALTAFGDHGAFFAFKLLLKKGVKEEVLLPLIEESPESQRLAFVDQYLQAEPDTRRHYADMFKGILERIKGRRPVVLFYAGLFDQKRELDPFLNHIDPLLRDSGAFMENEIASASPDVFIIGLKALAMVNGKIASQILIETLENQDVLKIRMAVYTLIEDASKGQYPGVFKPVWRHFCRSCSKDKTEAAACFRALVVCDRLPLSELMDRVKAQCPDIMPDVLKEITQLSRISFFFIQDMALNGEKYRTGHSDINRACMLGMVKKRPERVIKILTRAAKGQTSDTTEFLEKTKQLYLKEAQGIKSEFGMKVPSTGKPRYSLLTDTEKEKLQTRGNGSQDSFLNFQCRIMQNINLLNKTLSGNALYFNHTVIKGGDWSGSSISRAFFKNSVFVDIDLSSTRFEGVCFDNALFRNVNARGAVFRNCSFQGARLFNCDFSHGDLTDALFIGARIAKTDFNEAKLSYASFSHGDISAVSFSSASTAHADFSYVRARFVRFPAYPDIRTRGIDYNARKYQLDFNDLPEFPEHITAEINLLIFCEFIRYGKSKFLGQNKLSLLTAFDIFKPRQADFFQIVPLLIHENIELIGSNPIDSQTPCGIAQFCPSPRALAILENYSKQKELKGRVNLNPSIEGLYTMGSIGSLAQTPESDIDYWVCINEKTLSGNRLERLEQKLRMIEILAQDLFKTSVTFFVVDIQKAQRNDFGGSSQESSGSAQAWLLKEEFYRTMIHVAGKLPLWAVIPTSISLNYYNMILKRVNLYTESQRYVDLGDVHSIAVSEYFGASIWQMFKWLKSPFKSVIKMALFEIYAKTYGKAILLCNQYKNEWMNSGTQLKFARNDSYIAILNKLLTYYRSMGDTRSMDIILTCFFLKLEVLEKSEIDNSVFGIRKVLLDSVLQDWGWSREKVLELGHYRQWSYSKIRDLSTAIETYMLSKFEQMNKAFQNSCRNTLTISDSDRERLTRKVDIVYKKKLFKIKKLFLIAVNDAYFSNLHLKYHSEGKWELFHKNEQISKDHAEALFRSDRVEHICAWMVYNRLNRDNAQIGLVPNATGICHHDIQNLYRAISEFFAAELNPGARFYDITESLPTVAAMFITINLNAERPRSVVEDYCAVYLNSWGEMFCMPSLPGKSFVSLALAKKDIQSSMGIQTFPARTKIYFPRGRVA